MTKEELSNIIKHASATATEIVFNEENLAILDFPPPQVELLKRFMVLSTQMTAAIIANTLLEVLDINE